jgi:aryl-alcohol dehydrogenase-like predicted oxidoreductase
LLPVETVSLTAEYQIPRCLVGGWQLSPGHSPAAASRDTLFSTLAGFVDAGLSTFDCADIYGGVEALLGDFRQWYRDRYGEAASNRIQVHTKFVPDRDELPRISRRYVESIIDRSLRRLRTERLDLVQFHWWDYQLPRYLETAGWLAELRRAGKIRYLGATNFDTPRFRELLESGVAFVSHQVQYSLLDRRAERGMAELCRRHGVQLLCYGTVAGGFLSERFLGIPQPQGPPDNRSLVKYRLIIEEFGGWTAFQELLRALARVAERHQTGIATVATRWVLDQAQVAAAIVGARNSSHLEATLATFALRLDPEDRRALSAVLAEYPGPGGDVYGLERDPAGAHAAIMRYNLNATA